MNNLISNRALTNESKNNEIIGIFLRNFPLIKEMHTHANEAINTDGLKGAKYLIELRSPYECLGHRSFKVSADLKGEPFLLREDEVGYTIGYLYVTGTIILHPDVDDWDLDVRSMLWNECFEYERRKTLRMEENKKPGILNSFCDRPCEVTGTMLNEK